MIKILFVCHGNICRSPMAEFVFRDMVRNRAGRPILYSLSGHQPGGDRQSGLPGTTRKLRELGISTKGKYAVQMTKKDYENYDYLIGMESRNIRNMNRIIGSDPDHKVYRLLDFSDRPRDIADPWYTGNFDVTYNDIKEGCEALLWHILEKDRGRL